MLTSGDQYRAGSSIEVEKQRGQFPEASMHDKFGLARLTRRTRSFPWATS
jgi:hypothetical protein